MSKQYGSDLKKKYLKLTTDLANTNAVIKKRFFMIVANYDKYMSEDHKVFCIHTTLHTLPLDRMLEIIIKTEANYVEQTSKQLRIKNFN